MGQHNSFKKDIDMLSEAYHKMYGKGEVVEEGTHNALMKANKYYARLYHKGFD